MELILGTVFLISLSVAFVLSDWPLIFSSFFRQWTSSLPKKGEKNENLIRIISGNSNISVIYQFYKLENSHPMHIDVDKTKPPNFL